MYKYRQKFDCKASGGKKKSRFSFFRKTGTIYRYNSNQYRIITFLPLRLLHLPLERGLQP